MTGQHRFETIPVLGNQNIHTPPQRLMRPRRKPHQRLFHLPGQRARVQDDPHRPRGAGHQDIPFPTRSPPSASHRVPSAQCPPLPTVSGKSMISRTGRIGMRAFIEPRPRRCPKSLRSRFMHQVTEPAEYATKLDNAAQNRPRGPRSTLRSGPSLALKSRTAGSSSRGPIIPLRHGFSSIHVLAYGEACPHDRASPVYDVYVNTATTVPMAPFRRCLVSTGFSQEQRAKPQRGDPDGGASS